MSAPLWLRGLRSRPFTFALLAALCAAGVMTSALGPLSIRAVGQSSLADAIALAGPAASSIAASVELDRDDDLDEAIDDVAGVFVGSTRGDVGRVWSPPRIAVQTTSGLGWQRKGSREAELVSRVASAESACSELALTEGRCPGRSGEVLVSSADASRSGVTIGAVLPVDLPAGRTPALRVVGVYDPDRSATVDLLRPASLAGQLARVTADPLIMTRADLSSLDLGRSVTGRIRLSDGLGLQDEQTARATIAQVQTASVAVADRLVVFDSGLPRLLDDVDQRVASASVLILVAVAQAELLTLFALIIALQQLGRSRAAEWAVGRLRGMPRRHWLVSIWAEPASALALGLPVGLWAAVWASRAIVGHELRSGTPVEWTRWPVLVAAGGACLVALVALVAVSLRDLRRPLIDVLQQTSEARRVSRPGVVIQFAVVLLATAALYQLVSGGVLGSRGSRLGLLAPTLMTFAVAVIAVRVTVVLVRRATTRAPRSLSGLVVGRNAARVPSALNPAMVVAAGLALTVFSTQVLALSTRNQGLRAEAIVGAPTVLQVATPAGADLVAAVRAADPSGQNAMAVQEKATSSDGGTSRIVAIDSARVDAVAPWVAGWTETPSLAQALHPSTTQPIALRGERVDLAISTIRLATSVSQGYPPPAAPPQLSLIVQVDAGPWQFVALGPLRDRPAHYRAPLPCADGCRLVGIDLLAAKSKAYEADFTISELSTDREPPATLAPRLRQPDGWRERIGHLTYPDRSESLTPTPTAAGLRIQATDPDGELSNRAVPTDTDDPLPAVVAPTVRVDPFPGLADVASGTGLDGRAQLIKVVGRAVILPRALDDGVLVDLSNAERLSDPVDSETTDEVWLSEGAPAGIEERLTEQGLTVLGREELDTTREALLQQGNTRGAVVALWIALAGLLTGLLAFAGARSAEATRRAADWASLREAGLTPRTTWRLAFVEIAAPALIGVSIGVTSGVLAVGLGAARLPLVDVFAPHPPLDVALAVGPIVWLAAAIVVVVLVLAWVGATLENRRVTTP